MMLTGQILVYLFARGVAIVKRKHISFATRKCCGVGETAMIGESGVRSLRNIQSTKTSFAALLPFKQRRIRSNGRVCKNTIIAKVSPESQGKRF